MLAHEIYQKANEQVNVSTSIVADAPHVTQKITCKHFKQGVPCDLLTGEEQLFASGDKDIPAGHLACTVECARLHIADTCEQPTRPTITG